MARPQGGEAGPGAEHTAPRGRRQAYWPADGKLTPEQLEALGTAHSGLAEVTMQELAVLVRCRAAKPLEAEELVRSLFEWFGGPLSTGEISGFIDRMVEQRFLVRFDAGTAFQTTALGWEVIEQSQRPMLKTAMWMIAGTAQAGDDDEAR